MLDQINITDTSPDKFEFLIGYIRGFQYLADDVKEVFDPHPIIGNVYQLLKRDECYILHLGDKAKTELKGIFLGPELTAHVENKWDVDIVVINKDNMLDYPISSEGLQRLSNWLDTNHEDLKKELYGIKQTEGSPIKTLASILELNPNNHVKMAQDLNELRMKDPDSFGVVQSLVSYLNTSNTQLALRGSIMRSQTPEGFCSSAISTVEDYLHMGDEDLVLKLMELCTYEINRRIYQDDQNETE